MKTYIGGEPVTFKGAAVKVAAKEGSTVIGTLRARSVAGAPAIPGVVTHTHGKGRVAYFASGFDSAYYLYPNPYQRLVIKNAIQWAAAAPPPMTVEAPMCVHSTLMRQVKPDGERLIVHLFNDLNTTAHHALPVDDVPLREEVVPIHDIRITFCAWLPFPTSAHPGTRREGPGSQEDGRRGSVVVVPRLEVHSMVVGELVAD